MTRLVAKLMENDDPADLKTAAEAYLAGVPTDGVRAMDADHFLDHDQDLKGVLVMVHEGIDLPGSKTADAQLVAVDKDTVTKAQAALDEALADAVHHEAVVADADTTVAGKVTSAGGTPFAATDVGRKIRIGAEVRTVTVFNANNDVDYDNSVDEGGDFASGSGLTLDLLGAESIQGISLTCHKAKDRDTVYSVRAVVEGETP